MVLNNSYNSQNITNTYNNKINNNPVLKPNLLNPIHITSVPNYYINIYDIYSYPNLCYIADVVTNIYLPDTTINPNYNYFSFTIINPLQNDIYLYSQNNKLIYSTIFNSVSGDTSMAIQPKRTIKINYNETFWNVFIN
jgi:hypothetical protein